MLFVCLVMCDSCIGMCLFVYGSSVVLWQAFAFVRFYLYTSQLYFIFSSCGMVLLQLPSGLVLTVSSGCVVELSSFRFLFCLTR